MNTKQEILNTVKEEFDRWETLLSGLTEDELTARRLLSDLSVKDVMAHLMAWQQRSIARLQAGLDNTEPTFPEWPTGLNPDLDEAVEGINAWIHEKNRDKPWPVVYKEWKDGYLRFMELGKSIPEKDLADQSRFKWLEGNSLLQIMQYSYEHHHFEHFEPLQAWLREHGNHP